MINRAYLTLLIGGIVPLPAPQPVVDALLSAQVTISSDQRSGFQLVFGMSRSSTLSRVLLPTGYFDPQTRVILIMTVNGVPNVIMDGFILRQEMTPSNDLGKSTLTVTGEDVSVMMSLQEVKMLYPVLSENLIVTTILAKYLMYGLIPLAIPPIFPNVTDPLEQIPAQSETDLDYINKLAKRVGYVFFVVPGPLPGANLAYFGPEVRIGIPQPALNINMDQYSNVESLSFSIDGSSREQLAIAIQEPITGLTIPIPLPDLTPLSPPMALRYSALAALQVPQRDGKTNAAAGDVEGARRRDQSGGRGHGFRSTRRPALRTRPASAPTRRRARRRTLVRRSLLRQEHDPQYQCPVRRVQAKLSTSPQRHGVAHAGRGCITEVVEWTRLLRENISVNIVHRW